MKLLTNKYPQIVLTGIAVCLLVCNVRLLYLHQQDENKLAEVDQHVSRMEHLREVEFTFKISKEITIARFIYEQFHIGEVEIYIGTDKNKTLPLRNIINGKKLVLGLNQDMCSPCVYGVLDELKKFFPDYETNPDIIYIADVEQRFKDNYFNKKVVSFNKEDDFPLYKIGMPYLFILDKDMDVKMLFITDKTSPELTQEYLKIIKERYPDI